MHPWNMGVCFRGTAVADELPGPLPYTHVNVWITLRTHTNRSTCMGRVADSAVGHAWNHVKLRFLLNTIYRVYDNAKSAHLDPIWDDPKRSVRGPPSVLRRSCSVRRQER